MPDIGQDGREGENARGNHRPPYKAKVALTALRGEKTFYAKFAELTLASVFLHFERSSARESARRNRTIAERKAMIDRSHTLHSRFGPMNWDQPLLAATGNPTQPTYQNRRGCSDNRDHLQRRHSRPARNPSDVLTRRVFPAFPRASWNGAAYAIASGARSAWRHGDG